MHDVATHGCLLVYWGMPSWSRLPHSYPGADVNDGDRQLANLSEIILMLNTNSARALYLKLTVIVVFLVNCSCLYAAVTIDVLALGFASNGTFLSLSMKWLHHE
jgi:hypothetical protein